MNWATASATTRRRQRRSPNSLPGPPITSACCAEYSFEEGGITKTGTVESEDRTFTTLPSTLEPALPDGRAWELVSPPKKHGASIDPSVKEGGLVQAAADGRSITYMATSPVGENEPEGYRGPERSQILATRSAGGWSSRDIATPNSKGLGALPGNPREYQFFSSQLEGALINPPDTFLLSSKVTEPTVYLRHNPICVQAPEECFEPLVDAENDTGKGRTTGMEILGATTDLKHVVLGSTSSALVTGAPVPGLYEWSGGELTPLTFLPGGGTSGQLVFLGAGTQAGNPLGRMTLTAISHDGSRVEWWTERNPHLYMRDVPDSETIQVDELGKGVSKPAKELQALFQTANADGSKIFFTDAERLTSTSKASEKPSEPDLYVFEPEKPAGERVTDLTIPLGEHEVAGVQGAITGASEDGKLVYFVANAVLAEGAKPGNCGAPGASGCNLYVEHDGEAGWEAPQLVARISSKDAPDWGLPNGLETNHLEYKTSQVSSSGQYLAFMSENSLTGYNNTDVNSGARDEEVFLYDHEGSGSLVCASCNPSGAQPNGVFDTDEETSEGKGLLVDRPEVWTPLFTEGSTDQWLAGSLPGWTAYATWSTNYQPRYLNNSGRLFFNSPDALVPRDSNGKEDVYQYEPTGVGNCATANTTGGCVALISSGESERESAFLDASESGEDVFFLTTGRLAPAQDKDSGLDVYDARVCEAPGAEPCPQAAPPAKEECNGEACKGAAQGPQTYEGPGTSNPAPSGNVVQPHVLGVTESKPPTKKPLTKAQKLAKALKTCHKIKSKKKRASCEKTAHKRYGPFKSSKPKHASVHRAQVQR